MAAIHGRVTFFKRKGESFFDATHPLMAQSRFLLVEASPRSSDWAVMKIDDLWTTFVSPQWLPAQIGFSPSLSGRDEGRDFFICFLSGLRRDQRGSQGFSQENASVSSSESSDYFPRAPDASCNPSTFLLQTSLSQPCMQICVELKRRRLVFILP